MRPISIRWERHIAYIAACLAVALLAGCFTNSEVVISDVEMSEVTNEGEMSVADLIANGKYGEAEELARTCMRGGRHPFPYANAVVKQGSGAGLQKQYRNFEPAQETDVTMHRLNLCSVLLLEGKKDEAHLELLKVRDELELMFDPDSQALKLTHGEREKFFKGDGYERATLYAFLAMSFMERGDFIKALKCVQCGILADSDAEKADYRADYALLPYIGYVAARNAGDNWRQEAKKYDALVKELTGTAPSGRALPNALIVAWIGRGADRTLGGEFDEKRFVRRGSPRGGLDAIAIRVGGEENYSLPGLADLNYQATTRGRRMMDHVLDSKATAKRGLAASANVLLAFGANCFTAGAASGNVAFATVMFSVGGLCVGIGCPTHFIGMAINAKADDRCWQSLPGQLVVVPLNIPRRKMKVELRGFYRLDNVSDKEIVVDFSGVSEKGVSVSHVSLIADRGAIEHVIDEGLARSADVIAARTKENAFADKVELTTEDNR